MSSLYMLHSLLPSLPPSRPPFSSSCSASPPSFLEQIFIASQLCGHSCSVSPHLHLFFTLSLSFLNLELTMKVLLRMWSASTYSGAVMFLDLNIRSLLIQAKSTFVLGQPITFWFKMCSQSTESSWVFVSGQIVPILGHRTNHYRDDIQTTYLSLLQFTLSLSVSL